ncbi:MAG: alcohol dehydrogenase catalytic domain-containing protein, partial [Clostridia bacterium]|nr:alcohol dehydrogenase catalytic domain-containing protein [Clostridia bacterium]
MNNRAAYLAAIKQYEVKDAPMPAIEKDTDVLVKIEYVGICGADLDMWETGRYGIFNVEYPQIIGHEASGVVVETGKAVSNVKPGDCVAMEPGIPCGVCPHCVTGEYNLCPNVVFKGAPPVTGCNQKYVTHPAQWCFVLPEGLPTRDGALLEPLAVGMHAANQGGVNMGDTVVICGGGTIGLSALNACKAKGATKILVVEQSPVRLQAAERMGAITI